MNLNSLKLLANRKLLVVKKYSPEILVTVGIVGVITSTVMACKATTKAHEVLDKAKEKKDKIDEAMDYANSRIDFDENDYTEKDRKKDLVLVYTQTGVDFAKLYGPSVILGTLSIGCILGAQHILRKRNLALVAAYAVLDDSFKKYRSRVIADAGEEKDLEYQYGVKEEKVETVVVDEATGKSKKVKSTKKVVDPNGVSLYARFFDELNQNWNPIPEYNMAFLKHQQNYFNDLLRIRGHVFLNEVYDELGMERSSAGAVVGWVLTKDSESSDNYIDFGLYDATRPRVRDFVNCTEASILLDFNVDGTIYDKI